MRMQRVDLPVHTHTYWYEDEDGMSSFVVERYEPKAFQLCRLVWNDLGGLDFVPGLGNTRPILYRLADIAEFGRSGSVIFFCEGEKDADTLRYATKVITTTNYGGPRGKWHDEYTQTLSGHQVVILPDNDDEGREHAKRIELELRRHAKGVAILELPGLAVGGDVSDWLGAGGTGEELWRLARSVPLIEWVPTEPEPPVTPPTGPVAVLTRLDEVVSEKVSWLWEGWLPRGKLVLLGGHPGDGKSTLTTAMAATLSVGGQWPDGSRVPVGGTIFLLAEDSLSDTVRPRLEQHGADLAKIRSLDTIRELDGSQRVFSLAEHLDMLEDSILETGAELVVIDPLTAFMSSRNRNDDGETRDLLTPLGQLAERCHVTILCVMHVGKPGQAKRTPLQSFMGATAFGAVARQALAVHPISGGDRKLLAVIKSNVAVKPPALEWSRPQDQPIVWHGPSEHDPETLFSGGGNFKQPRDDAAAFLTAALADGPRLSREVTEEAGERGISEMTLRRAAKGIGVEYRKGGPSRESPWFAGLPETDWPSFISEIATASEDAEPRLPDHVLCVQGDQVVVDQVIDDDVQASNQRVDSE